MLPFQHLRLNPLAPVSPSSDDPIRGVRRSLEDENTFCFVRGFPDFVARERMKAKFCEGEFWKRELENLLMPMIDKYEVVLMDDNQGLIEWK